MFQVKFKLKKNSKYQLSFLLFDTEHKTMDEAKKRVDHLMNEHPPGTEIYIFAGKGDAEKFIISKKNNELVFNKIKNPIV